MSPRLNPGSRGAMAALAAWTAFGAAMLGAGCSPEPAEEAPVVRPVRTLQVFATGGERERSFSGTARAGVESRLSFKVGGTVQEVLVDVGDRVAAGSRIARLDPTDLDLQLQDAQASLDRSTAEARQAEASYERVRQLYENKNASRADLDAARAASEAAAAAVQSSASRVDLARSNRGYADLRAPLDGAISAVEVEVNENVSPGQVVAVLSSGTRTEVTATVPEALIADVRAGDAVQVAFDSVPGGSFPATVTEVGISATQAGATFPVVVRLTEETRDIRPGMAAEVTFRFGTRSGRERLHVPASAVLEDRDGRFVFRVRPDGTGTATVERRRVTVGELGADGLEILDGITDGDVVVTAGVTKIRDGMTVRLPEDAGS